MSRIYARPVILFILVCWLAQAGCAPQAAPVTLYPPASQPGGDGAAPSPTITPAVLLPGTPVGTLPTPFSTATLSARASVAGAPSAVAPIPILMYHQIKDLPPTANVEDLTWTVSPASLDAQLGYLAEKGYTTISLDQLLDGFAGKVALPPKAVVITFDDGWKSQYTNALPLLKKYHQTATFYVVSTYMGYGAYFDWAMTEEIKNAGMTIGGHTLDHAMLTKLSAAEVDSQLRDSKAALEKKLTITVAHFAYPYGAYTDATIEAVKRAGYRSATTLNPAAVKNPLSPYQLPRLRVSYKETLADFARKLP